VRILTRPDSGTGGAHEFVSETAGEERRRSLVGLYLPGPRWFVRAATFEGDIEARAEEWTLYVRPSREVRGIQHTLPESKPGASLDEAAARRLAAAALADQYKIDTAQGQAREVSARPEKLKARTDWTFIFTDTTIPPLPQGEPRLQVRVAGDEVAGIGRFVFIPEEWERKDRAAQTRNLIITIANRFVFGGLLVAAAALAILMWSRKRYTPRLFVAVASLMFAVSLAGAANNWPTTESVLVTALPFALQVAAGIGGGLIALAISATLVGLAFGALPQRLASSATLPATDAWRLGIAVGLAGAALSAAAARLATPVWARVSDLDAAGTFLPLAQVAIDPIGGFLLRTAVMLSALTLVDGMTAGWTRRRAPSLALLAVIGFLGAGTPVGHHLGGWLVAGLVLAVALPAVAIFALRFDLTMVPIALGTMAIVSVASNGIARAFPGALAGSLLAIVILALTAWWVFRSLRRWRDAAAAAAG
jgi:MFS family permease